MRRLALLALAAAVGAIMLRRRSSTRDVGAYDDEYAEPVPMAAEYRSHTWSSPATHGTHTVPTIVISWRHT